MSAKLVQAECNGVRSNCRGAAEFRGVMKSRRKYTNYLLIDCYTTHFFFPPVSHCAAFVLLEAAVAVNGQAIEGIVEPLELVVGEVNVPAAEILLYALLIA